MRHSIRFALAAAAALVVALTPAPAGGDWFHSIFVTPSGPEATTWCGAAVAQMAMTGYPGGTSCTVAQATVQADITAHKSEVFWDADPAGMKWVLEDCGGNWPIIARNTRPEFMYLAARWMGKYNYPVPVVVGTAATVDHAHDEHWVLITGIRTDVDPTTSPAPPVVNLVGVWLIDPGATVAVMPGVLYKNAAQWDAFFQPVTKPASAYLNKFVGVIEPPDVPGRAVSLGRLVLSGRPIGPERALASAREAIERHRLADHPAFKELLAHEPLPPILVNRAQGGYYMVPYPASGETAGMAILINAYDGSLLEAGSFEPIRLLGAERARELALAQLPDQPGEVEVEAVYLNEAGHLGRYSPTWKVRAGRHVVGVSQSGAVTPGMTDELFALSLGSRRLTGIAGTGDRLWITDASTGEALEVLPATGGVVKRLALEIERPRGLAFDGERLWVANQKAMKIEAFDPEQGGRVRSIPLEVPPEKGFGSVEAVAWDGRYLWTAIAAGFSSSLNQIDPESGRIVRSLFADCDPRGLASDGERLWTLCYNGENRAPTVDERLLREADAEVVKSRRFFKKAEGRGPSALNWDGEFLWYTDAERNRAVRFTTPERRER